MYEVGKLLESWTTIGGKREQEQQMEWKDKLEGVVVEYIYSCD